MSKDLFALDSVVNYFTSRGSPFLDASKAFDRVNHYALFTKWIHLCVPLYLLNVIVCWHMKLSSCVLWCGLFCEKFLIKSGVSQGGINSSWFFNVYQNNLLLKPRFNGSGGSIFDTFACLLFADDILLLSGYITITGNAWCVVFMESSLI